MGQYSAHAMPSMGWWRFTAMITTSTLIMFPLMYQLVYSPDHLTFSLNRALASLVMGCVMTIVMLAYMWQMYRGLGTKLVVLVVAALAAATLLYVNRTQALIGDLNFMRSMIPHHSIAINNALRSDLHDARVRELAKGIISSQLREIAQMKALISAIKRDGIQHSPSSTNIAGDLCSMGSFRGVSDRVVKPTLLHRAEAK